MSQMNSKAKSKREGGKAMLTKKLKVALLVVVFAVLTALTFNYEAIQSNALVLGCRAFDMVQLVIK